MKRAKVDNHLVVGLGEVGLPLFQILKDKYKDNVEGYDIQYGVLRPKQFKFLHICLPWTDNFVFIVNQYQKKVKPEYTIIHSTVPIGTTDKIKNAVHSPVLGRHTTMKSDMLKFTKWVGGDENAEVVGAVLADAGFNVRVGSTAKETELLKLMCLAKYGVYLALAQYQMDLCNKYDVFYDSVINWDRDYNANLPQSYWRPLLNAPGDKIGGHCVIPATRLLNKQHPNDMLKEVLKYA